MSTPPSALDDALDLLGYDLRVHLGEADSLASQCAEWSDEDAAAARELIGDLTLMIRGLLIEHERQDGGDCHTCTSVWPCPVVTTIHGFVKDPQRQFVALVSRVRDGE